MKTAAYLRHVAKTGDHLAKYFGSEFPVEDLTPDRIRDYVRLRREGVISGHVAGASTIHRDLGMLKATLNWAGTVYESRRPILERNPLDKVKFPREKDPKRPVLQEETIEGLLAVAEGVHPYLRPLIVLARRTGRRLSAILNLRWDDTDLTKGMIRWRAEHDKVRRTWMVPMHPEVHAELLRLRKVQGAIGSTLLFPHPRQERRPGQAVSRHLAVGGVQAGQTSEARWEPLAYVQTSLGHRAKAPSTERRCRSGRMAGHRDPATVLPAVRPGHTPVGYRVRATATIGLKVAVQSDQVSP